MASLLATNTLGSYPLKHDIKDSEHANHVEVAEHVEEVQVHDIHLESHPGSRLLDERGDEPKGSLLTLPVEIRLRIYEMAYDASYLHSKLQWENGLKLQLQGTSGTDSGLTRLVGSPFTLMRVCRMLYTEVKPMLPPISHVALHFDNFSHDDMHRWLELLSDSQITQTRSFEITGWSSCRLKHPLFADGHHMKCRRYRSFTSTYPIACTESCKDLGQDEGYVSSFCKVPVLPADISSPDLSYKQRRDSVIDH